MPKIQHMHRGDHRIKALEVICKSPPLSPSLYKGCVVIFCVSQWKNKSIQKRKRWVGASSRKSQLLLKNRIHAKNTKEVAFWPSFISSKNSASFSNISYFQAKSSCLTPPIPNRILFYSPASFQQPRLSSDQINSRFALLRFILPLKDLT